VKSFITLTNGLIFKGKTRSLVKWGALERCRAWLGDCLGHKWLTELERLAREKHSSLFLHKHPEKIVFDPDRPFKPGLI
jgi:hypothetical protein